MYSTNITDNQWQVIEKKHKRARKEEETLSSRGAPKAIQKQGHKFPRLKKNLADGGYRGSLGDWVMEKCGWVVEFVLWPIPPRR